MHWRCGVFKIALCAALLGCGDRQLATTADQPATSPPIEVDSLTALGDSLYRAGEYAQAKEALSVSLARVRAQRDIAAEGRILTSLGLTEFRLGDYDAARARAQQAREILETNGLRTLLPRTYNALGLIAWDQGHLSEAAGLWQLAMKTAREVNDQEYVDRPAMNLGLYYAGIGAFEEARAAFTSSLVAGRRLGNRPLELRSLVNLAMVANQMGEPRLALAWLDSASHAGVEEDFLAEDNHRSQLALAAWAVGDPGVALAALDSAIRRARSGGHRQSEAANLTLMASIYWDAGDAPRALHLNAQAEAIHRDLDLPAEQGQNLHQAARIQMASGHTVQASNLARRALDLHRRAEDLVHELDDRLLMAELGDTTQLIEARRITSKIATRAARTQLGLAEARIAAHADQPRSVLRALGAIASDLASGLSAEVSESEALRARAYASLEQWDSAAASGRRAIAALDRIRSGQGSELLRASFASFRAGIYGNQVAALLALEKTSEAFMVADAARGAHMSSVNAPGIHAAAREESLYRIAALEEEIRTREADGLNAAELRELLRQAQRQYEIGVLNTGSVDSGAANSRSITQIRKALAPDEVMLAYLVAPKQLFVFAVTRSALQFHVVPVSAAELEARVRLARQLLGNPTTTPQAASAVMQSLSQWLLGPLGAEAPPARRVIIVPHGVLAYLPFAALQTTSGKYLIERYSLVLLPSAAFISRSASRAGLAHAPSKVTALAPQPNTLPATALEVKAIRQSHRGATIVIGRRANETALRRALASSAVSHVATHGVLNRVNPLFSRIELVPGKTRSPDNDGRLEVHEVMRLEIRSPLVFLSGCETGVGPGGSRRYSPGEDYTTLAAAFLAAGAGQVVATLWPIRDSGAAVFATQFYHELRRSDAADAMAVAQRAMLSQPRLRHPFYWAGYQIAGAQSIRGRFAVQ